MEHQRRSERQSLAQPGKAPVRLSAGNGNKSGPQPKFLRGKSGINERRAEIAAVRSALWAMFRKS